MSSHDLEAWLASAHIDWEVWISTHVVIALYDSMYTAWDRHSGEQVYRGPNYHNEALPPILKVISQWGAGTGPLTLGEVFSTGY